LKAEKGEQPRNKILDNRIHALLYFLPPTGKDSVNQLDFDFLQRLATKVNVIPVIGKADSLLPTELGNYKQAILSTLAKFNIQFYPTYHAEDREFIESAEKHVPFALIGSDELVSVDGKMLRGRKYKWGSVIGKFVLIQSRIPNIVILCICVTC
jgi:septin family protein